MYKTEFHALTLLDSRSCNLTAVSFSSRSADISSYKLTKYNLRHLSFYTFTSRVVIYRGIEIKFLGKMGWIENSRKRGRKEFTRKKVGRFSLAQTTQPQFRRRAQILETPPLNQWQSSTLSSLCTDPSSLSKRGGRRRGGFGGLYTGDQFSIVHKF